MWKCKRKVRMHTHLFILLYRKPQGKTTLNEAHKKKLQMMREKGPKGIYDDPSDI